FFIAITYSLLPYPVSLLLRKHIRRKTNIEQRTNRKPAATQRQQERHIPTESNQQNEQTTHNRPQQHMHLTIINQIRHRRNFRLSYAAAIFVRPPEERENLGHIRQNREAYPSP